MTTMERPPHSWVNMIAIVGSALAICTTLVYVGQRLQSLEDAQVYAVQREDERATQTNTELLRINHVLDLHSCEIQNLVRGFPAGQGDPCYHP